jgi:hypothetical protein
MAGQQGREGRLAGAEPCVVDSTPRPDSCIRSRGGGPGPGGGHPSLPAPLPPRLPEVPVTPAVAWAPGAAARPSRLACLSRRRYPRAVPPRDHTGRRGEAWLGGVGAGRRAELPRGGGGAEGAQGRFAAPARRRRQRRQRRFGWHNRLIAAPDRPGVARADKSRPYVFLW